MEDIHLRPLRLGEEKKERRRKKIQDQNIMSASATQGGHKYRTEVYATIMISTTNCFNE